jgi:hypothetical protein
MFVDSTYLQVDDDFSKNESYREETIEMVSVLDIGGFLDISDDDLFFLMMVLTLMGRRIIHPHGRNLILVTRYNG